MNVYAESSAVLAWLLGVETGHYVRKVLQQADLGAGLQATSAASDLAEATGHGDVENKQRFPHLHTPGGDYGQMFNKALH